jgi:hypothetical protein
MSRFFCLVTEHLDGHIRAHDGTQGTSCAFAFLAPFALRVFGRSVALDVELIAYPDGPLWARHDAKTASFTQIPVDPDIALLQKTISCSPRNGSKSEINDKAYLDNVSREFP